MICACAYIFSTACINPPPSPSPVRPSILGLFDWTFWVQNNHTTHQGRAQLSVKRGGSQEVSFRKIWKKKNCSSRGKGVRTPLTPPPPPCARPCTYIVSAHCSKKCCVLPVEYDLINVEYGNRQPNVLRL